MQNQATGSDTFQRLMHIGLVVKDMAQTIERLSALGIGPFTPRILPPDARETYRGRPFHPAERVTIQITRLGNLELELIQPLEGASPHREFLEQKGEGIQHLGFIVDDLAREVDHLTGEGSEILLTSQFKNGGGVAYLDLDVAGLIVELVQPAPR